MTCGGSGNIAAASVDGWFKLPSATTTATALYLLCEVADLKIITHFHI